ncbi:TetR/AcrR family transcriptional regulator [Enterococcus camelliae]|uniref:TetR/AcrR family transcriptional regulator n=1 Tax=Enterococcus camelliae TaxID=453959 RepID=A0ABW5TFF0_9ENTE
MRHKVYTKEQILKAARKLVAESGFEHFTARNIAKKMGGSTQPIYMHFKSMNELKRTLIEQLLDEIGIDVPPTNKDEKATLAEWTRYIDFAQTNPQIFKALFFENSGSGTELYQQSMAYFLKNHEILVPEHGDLSEEAIGHLHDRMWIASTGMALLKKSGIIHPSLEQEKKLLEQFVALLGVPKK